MTYNNGEIISYGGQVYELLWGLDCDGQYIELWGSQADESRLFFSYWPDTQGRLALQRHRADAPSGLETVFIDRAQELMPQFNEADLTPA